MHDGDEAFKELFSELNCTGFIKLLAVFVTATLAPILCARQKRKFREPSTNMPKTQMAGSVETRSLATSTKTNDKTETVRRAAEKQTLPAQEQQQENRPLSPLEYILGKKKTASTTTSKEKVKSKETTTPKKDDVKPSKEKVQSKEKAAAKAPSREKVNSKDKESTTLKMAKKIKSFFRMKPSGSKEKADGDKKATTPASVKLSKERRSKSVESGMSRVKTTRQGRKNSKTRRKKLIGDNLKTAEENVDTLDDLMNRVVDPAKAKQMGNIDDITEANKQERLKQIEAMPSDEFFVDDTQRSTSLNRDTTKVKIKEDNCRVYIMNPEVQTHSLREMTLRRKRMAKSIAKIRARRSS